MQALNGRYEEVNRRMSDVMRRVGTVETRLNIWMEDLTESQRKPGAFLGWIGDGRDFHPQEPER